MRRRQTVPRQWLIITDVDDDDGIATAASLPRGSGVLLLEPLSWRAMRQLRTMARHRELVILHEGAGARRVHNARELRDAMLRRTPLILLSPLHRTRSHPDWMPIPRMRAASLARLGGRRLIALGGMDAKRYAALAPLGFIGWAGISAFRT